MLSGSQNPDRDYRWCPSQFIQRPGTSAMGTRLRRRVSLEMIESMSPMFNQLSSLIKNRQKKYVS